jgi:hypothetical protein
MELKQNEIELINMHTNEIKNSENINKDGQKIKSPDNDKQRQRLTSISCNKLRG